ncbi:uncharacterized protein TRIADDRAFT_60399 [Trichoplax adhaerens]|uniref:ANK_REP_REGION domain-containing protein n=1 Tax=Trichoplax adhaerens TaxID=10228 RepID=B3S843_TRIAD|nr:hypothetical protein TRIADDRAFT_60399 [Trichoplax adhaerens]EDV21038.1 hypothetical protein TRIADDRAFT_60399 [Trichoplax adhaerens]|eukprot:XP_002116368.1 hypothetical protein TRIADDRAFT_60399 [Trichoplax adhaerens]
MADSCDSQTESVTPINICDFYWRSRLCSNTYRHGDPLIEFSILWPDSATLQDFLENITITHAELKDFCLIALRCGPFDVISCLLKRGFLPNDQQEIFGNYNFTMLHVAALAGNLPVMKELSKQYSSMKRMKDELGRLPEEIASIDSKGSTIVTDRKRNGKKNKLRSPTDTEIKEIFQWLRDPNCYDEFLLKMQLIELDVNRIKDENGDLMLHVAVTQGISHIPFIMALVYLHHASIEATNENGLTPLCVAAKCSHSMLADILICVLGASPNTCNSRIGWSPLHYAAARNDYDTARFLVMRGADVNVEDENGRRPDDVAERNGLCYALLQTGRSNRIENLIQKIMQDCLRQEDLRQSDLCLTDENDCTLLMVAVKQNSLQSIEILTRYKHCPLDAQDGKDELIRRRNCQVRIADISGWLPLHHAAYNAHEEIVSLILSSNDRLVGLAKAQQLCQSTKIGLIITDAQLRRRREIVKPMVFDCCTNGDCDRLYSILEEGDNLSNYVNSNENPIFIAAHNGYTGIVKILIENGVDIRCKEPNSDNTLLHIAAQEGHKTLVEFLIPYINPGKNKRKLAPIDVNALNSTGFTALQLAADKGHREILRIFLENGASTALLDVNGNLYCSEFDGLQVLIDNSRKERMELFKRFCKDKSGLTKLRSEWLIPFDYNLRDENDDTFLMYAAYCGRLDVINFLLEPTVKTKNAVFLDFQSGSTTPASDGQRSSPGTPVGPYTPASLGRSPELKFQHNGKTGGGPARSRSATDSSIEGETARTLAAANNYEQISDATIRRRLSLRRNDSAFSRWSMEDSNADSESYIEGQNIDVRLLPSNEFVCAVNPRDGYTALHRAVQGSDSNVGIVKVLINANNECLNMSENSGNTALHLACQLRRKMIIKALLNFRELDVNIQNENGLLADDLTALTATKQNIKKLRDERTDYQKPMDQADEVAVSSDGTSIDFDVLNAVFKSL